MARVSDFRINSEVRRILIKNYLNLKKLRYSSIGGVVYLRGTIEIMRNARIRRLRWQGVTDEYMKDLEKAIKKVTGVKRVRFELYRWEKRIDGWRKKRE